MSMLFGARSKMPNKLGSIQVQTSEYGVVIPYGAGTFKAPIKLIDYQDFTATKVAQGGKGGGGGSSDDYKAAIDCAICAGPIDGIGNVFDSAGGSDLIYTAEVVNASGSYTVAHSGDAFQLDEGVTRAVPYSVQASDFGSDGNVTISGTTQAPLQKVASGTTLASGQYSVSTSGTYSFAAADNGVTMTIGYTYISDPTQKNPMERYNLGVILGRMPSNAWGYMQSMHPTRAIRYDGLARVVAQAFDLGSSASPPNLSIEVINARGLAFGGGIADCDPAAILFDICNDPVSGLNWPYLGDTTQFSNFCVANDLFLSPFIDNQQKATQIIQNICDLTNATPVWSGGLLKIVPYGDTTAVGNNRTYSPQTQPVYSIDYSDMVAQAGQEPVLVSRPGLADNYNSISFQYTRRDQSYNNDIINEKDEASILMNGLLPSQTIDGSFYREKEYAAKAANLLLKRNSVAPRQFSFTLKWWYQLVEAMDILLLQRKLGGDYTAVRVISTQENDDLSIAVVAEEFLYRVGDGVAYPKGDPSSQGAGAHDQPGNTNVLAVFQPNTRLTGGQNQLWAACAGGPSWGGCDMYISVDNTTYRQVARLNGPSRAGVVSAPIAAGSDPDTTNTLSVSINGTLLDATQADADAFATLCLVGAELMSYETAHLTGSTATTNSYDLSYLRRGVFANNSQSHTAGEQFVRLDDQIIKYGVDPTLVGRILYLKFVSFNLFGLEEQDISTVTPRQVLVGGSLSAQNMAVTSAVESGGATAAIYITRQGSPIGTAGSGTLTNGATVTLPAQTFTGKMLNQFYAFNFNPASSAYVTYTDSNAWLADQQSGMLGIGVITTPSGSGGGGGGGGTTYTPTQYSDVGSASTSNPDGAYNAANAPAVVNSYASSEYFSPSRPTMDYSNDGVCSWFGFAGTTTAAMSLKATLAASFASDGSGSAYAIVSYTLDGNNWTTLASFGDTNPSTVFSANVPSGTDLSLVQVQCGVHSSVPSATGSNTSLYASMQVSVSNLHIE